jgi:hypothetical protein
MQSRVVYQSASPQADITGFPSAVLDPPSTWLNSRLIKTSKATNERQVSGVEDYITQWRVHRLYSFFFFVFVVKENAVRHRFPPLPQQMYTSLCLYVVLCSARGSLPL